MKNLSAMTDNELRDYETESKAKFDDSIMDTTTAFGHVGGTDAECDELLQTLIAIDCEKWSRDNFNYRPSADEREKWVERVESSRAKLAKAEATGNRERIYRARYMVERAVSAVAFIESK